MYSKTIVVQSATKNLCNNLFDQLSIYCNEYEMKWCNFHQSILSKIIRESQEWNC